MNREVVREYPYSEIVLYEVEELMLGGFWTTLVPNHGTEPLRWTDIDKAEAVAIERRVKYKRDTRVVKVTL